MLEHLRAQLLEFQFNVDTTPSGLGNRYDFGELAENYGIQNNLATPPPVIVIEGIDKLTATGLEDLVSAARALHAKLAGSKALHTKQPTLVLTGTQTLLDLIMKNESQNPSLAGMHYDIGHEFHVPPTPPYAI